MLDKVSAVTALNAYSFNAIWNSTQSERRVNIALDVVSPRMQTSSITFRRAVVGLPTTGMGMVYYASFDLLSVRSGSLQTNTWYDLTKFLNLTQTKLSLYDSTGHLVPLSQVWFYIVEASNEFILFVPKRGLRNVPNGYSTAMFLTAYYNAKTDTRLQAWSYRLSTDATTRHTQVMNLQNDLASLDMSKVTLIQNGYEVDPNQPITYGADDCLDLIYDENIMASFVVDVDTNITGYQSALYNGYRELIHCPKTQNPNNWIVTHDAITMYVRDKNSNRGVYLHRVPDNSVEQVTHNDISIDRMFLNALMAGLGAESISVKVIYHEPYDPHVLPLDVSLIQDLYLCDDDTIVQHLRGAIDPINLPFWKASSLESSTFLDMMFNNTADTSDTTFAKYTEGLGYFGVSSALGGNVYSGTYRGSEMVITKPFALRNTDALPLVFVNGRKVPQAKIAFGIMNSNQMAIDIDPALVSIGDAVNIVIYTDSVLKVTEFTPTVDAPFITVADQDFTLYERVAVEDTAGFFTSTVVGYQPVTIDGDLIKFIANADGSYDLAFDRTLFQGTYVVIPNVSMYGVSFDLDDYIENMAPIILPLQTTSSVGVSMPLLRTDSVDVFVNGYALVKDVDYTLTPAISSSGATVFTDLVVTNRGYLDITKTGNIIEIFVHTDQTLSVDSGYVYNGILARTDRPSVWFPNIGTAFINGLLTTGLTDDGAWLVSPNTNNGALFTLKTQVPSPLKSILSDVDETSELVTIKAIDTYLGRNTPAPPAVMGISSQHQLYSPYVMAIITDICNGTLSAVYDANRETFMAQFSAYNYIKERDPTLLQSGAIDRKFCSVSAAFAQYPKTTVLATRIIQALIAAVGIETDATLGDTFV